jgi:hypothetical protein
LPDLRADALKRFADAEKAKDTETLSRGKIRHFDESSPTNSTFSVFQRRKAQAEPKKKTRDKRNLGVHLCIATKQKGANTKEMQLQITQFAELKQQNRRKPLRQEGT